MKLHDISFTDPQQNLDYDDELLRLADREGAEEALRFWESPVCFAVLGRTCCSSDVTEETAKQGLPVLRRRSGGGTVLQGPGCLNFAVVLSKQRPGMQTITGSYLCILGKICEALKLDHGIEASFRPICDLVLEGERKFSGNAQRRGRNYILHHGTILYSFDLSLITRFLSMPPKMPEYRKSRCHDDFVANLPLTASQIKKSIQSALMS